MFPLSLLPDIAREVAKGDETVFARGRNDYGPVTAPGGPAGVEESFCTCHPGKMWKTSFRPPYTTPVRNFLLTPSYLKVLLKLNSSDQCFMPVLNLL